LTSAGLSVPGVAFFFEADLDWVGLLGLDGCAQGKTGG
jgi:hypothetical protein